MPSGPESWKQDAKHLMRCYSNMLFLYAKRELEAWGDEGEGQIQSHVNHTE